MSCALLSDRMAAVRRGGSEWTGEERRHLESCADCGAEWRLLTGAAALGRDYAPDVARISAGALVRVAADRRARTWRRRTGILAVAAVAAALLLIVILPGADRGVEPPARATTLELAVPELDSLNADQLEAVLQSLGTPLGEASTLDPVGLLELDDQQLERVLRSLEG